MESKRFLLQEANVSLLLTLVDTPGFGQGLDNSHGWKPLVKTIDSFYEDYLRMELGVNRRTVGSGASYQSSLSDDKRIHLCLYFVSANGHGLHSLDIETLKRLHDKVNKLSYLCYIIYILNKKPNMFKNCLSTFVSNNILNF